MKKAAALIFAALMCFALAACGAQPAANIQDNGAQKYAQTGGNISFAHATEVYANPDSYAGKTYSGMFQISSVIQQLDDMPAYYAKRFNYIGVPDSSYTVLGWNEKLASLSSGDIVYVRGTIKGKKTITIGKKTMDAMLLIVSGIEKNAAKENIVSDNLQYTFDPGQCSASSDTVWDEKKGTLKVDITKVFFSESSMTVSTKTTDTALSESRNYHFDIILHQGDYFTWNFDSKFWVDPSSVDNFDYVLFPSLDGRKDITAEFVPFDGEGKLICEPLIFNISLSILKPSNETQASIPSQTAKPSASSSSSDVILPDSTPTQTVNPTQAPTQAPTQTLTPTKTVTPTGWPKAP